MKKVKYLIICILTMAVVILCVQVVKNVNKKPQTAKITNEITNEITDKITGDIELGTYYEDETGINLTPIKWKVLGEKDEYVLLISDKIIDTRPYNSSREDTNWENSTIRKWLNNDFLSTAFSENEQKSMKVGTELKDMVFLLSNEEVEQYLPTDYSRTSLPTAFAIKQGVYTNEVGESAWWLRSPVDDKTQTSYISSGGSFGNRPHYVDEHIIGVRPAIWIERSYIESKSEENNSNNTNTINVKSIWEKYNNEPSSRQAVYYGEHISATGIVRYIGKDSHGTPSMELAETKNGTGYILGVFGSYEEMNAVSVGDLVTIEGDFHIFGSDNMVVIKNTKLQ